MATLRIAVAGLVLAACLPGSAVASGSRGTADSRVSSAPPVAGQEGRELRRTEFSLEGRKLPPAPRHRRSESRRNAAGEPAPPTPVGTVREWLGLDDTDGSYYRKDYRLRAVGEHVEVWVAEDLDFPAGDCRGPVAVTDAQVGALIHEFDTVIYPRETAAFSTPPSRDGSDPVLSGDYRGDGDRTVTLVDNIRDDNFHDFPDSPTYVAGFFSAQLDELFDRNVMTIDAYDWAHRTGAEPPGDPTGDLCTSHPSRPRMYESTFAHEWQHLLQHYADPDEATWVNEGLSEYAQTLTGYVDSTLDVHHSGYDTHLICYQGFGVVRTAYNANPRDCGGPQNSLNLWDEGAPAEVLADYGIAYQFMLYLHDRFGPELLSALHRDGRRQGLDGVQAALPTGTRVASVLHAFQAGTLTDRIVGGTPSLRSAVNLANPAAYDVPGAAPNGADYVRLRDAAGRRLRGRDLRSVTFAGARTLPPLPLEWTIADGVLFSGNRSGTDVMAVLPVTVPAADPVLRFDALYGAEDGYDFGYVTVSVDGGRTYTPIAGDETVAGPLGPGLTGNTYGFRPHRFDLSAHAGKKVLIGFRYVSDRELNLGGWQITAIALGGTPIPVEADRFRSPTRIRPTAVHAWSPRLVGLAADWVKIVPVRRFAELRDFPEVVAIVAYDEPTERYDQYAPYVLTVNGVRQPG